MRAVARGRSDRSRLGRILLLGACLTVRCVSGTLAADVPRAVLVVNTQDASVSRVDLETMTETQRFPVGERPYGIAVLADGERVAVGVEGRERVMFYALDGFEPRGEVHIGPMHNDHVVLSADGRFVLLANYDSDAVIGIDAATMREAFRITGTSAPHVVKYGPTRTLAYVTCKKITGIATVDPAARTLVKFHRLNVNPRSLTFSADESRLFFGSFWVDGFFEMDPASGKVTRLFQLAPPPENAAPQEVTYHGVEAVGGSTVLAANEGRSYVDAVDVTSGKLLARLSQGVSNPCCIERIPGTTPVEVLVSNLGSGTLARVRVSDTGQLTTLGSAKVGASPKRVAFLE
jgi:DNA-binding beta-propeller fold protein YncE